ncbi:MAG: hypothetical protein IT456_26515 [Planctomycetes bacterium]|nr:hypothetical protein [Planctomycetota bacterium]
MVAAAVDAESVRRVDDDDGTRLEASGTLRVRYGIEADGEWSESAATEPVVYRVMFRPTAPAQLPATRASAIADFLGTQDGSNELRLRPADGRVPDLVVTW